MKLEMEGYIERIHDFEDDGELIYMDNELPNMPQAYHKETKNCHRLAEILEHFELFNTKVKITIEEVSK